MTDHFQRAITDVKYGFDQIPTQQEFMEAFRSFYSEYVVESPPEEQPEMTFEEAQQRARVIWADDVGGRIDDS